MSREVRRVPLDWDHPRNARGAYQPMHDRTLREAVAEWEQDRITHYGGDLIAQLEAEDSSPDPEYCRPEWPADAILGFQVYETVSEGTPLSPVFATEDQLVDWLTRPQPIGFGGTPLAMTPESARRFIAAGFAPTGVYTPATGLVSGLEVS